MHARGLRLEKLARWLLLSLAVALPFSTRLYFGGIDLEVVFPAEPLVALLGIVLFWRVVLAYRMGDVKIRLQDPIAIIACLWIGSLALSVPWSAHVLVSLKAFVVRSAFFLTFFLMPLIASNTMRLPWREMLTMHSLALMAVAGFSIVRQFDAGVGRAAAGLSPFPFYVDHTSYSAALTFALCFLTGEVLLRIRVKATTRWLESILIAGFIFVAFVLSFSRGAWLGLAGALVLLLLVRLPYRRSVAVGTAAMAIAISAWVLLGHGPALANSNGDGAGFKESVLSISNLKSDVSNMERLNRWKCALRMSKESPFLGHGVGSFQFVFPSYQREEEKTYISMPSPIPVHRVQRFWSAGDALIIRSNPQSLYCSGGTAHSEYLLALAESGIFSALLLVGLAFLAFARGWRMAKGGWTRERVRGFALWCALMAYLVHALFNNFLDDPKVAVLFWTSLMLFVRQWPSSGAARIRPQLPA